MSMNLAKILLLHYDLDYCQGKWCFVVNKHKHLLTTSTIIHAKRKKEKKNNNIGMQLRILMLERQYIIKGFT